MTAIVQQNPESAQAEPYVLDKWDRDHAIRKVAAVLYDLAPKTPPQREAQYAAYCAAVSCVEAWLVEIGAEVAK